MRDPLFDEAISRIYEAFRDLQTLYPSLVKLEVGGKQEMVWSRQYHQTPSGSWQRIQHRAPTIIKREE